ncbi:MAG: thioredoxin domain-containing protein, partial [Anaerolineales bacterium]|nr:thioredoxin domain-containing protein [Anaerolineales bacterium]
MKQILLILFLSFAGIFILSGCASETETPLTPALIVENPIIMDTPTSVIGCSVKFAEVGPTSAPGSGTLIPPVSASDFSLGPVDASVTLVEYCEFQSLGCAGMANVVRELLKNHDDLRFVFRPLPLIGILDKSDKAVLAALAADEQGQFWEMYELLFTKYNEWTGLSPDNFNAWVAEEASKIGIDGGQLTAAIQSDQTTTRMMSMYEAAKNISVAAVPLILINGELSYLLDYQNISDTIGLITLGQKQFTECPPFDIDASKQYTATIKTDYGDIVIGLFPDKAPLAVNSFVFLARAGWFDGVTFHRVIPGFAA